MARARKYIANNNGKELFVKKEMVVAAITTTIKYNLVV